MDLTPLLGLCCFNDSAHITQVFLSKHRQQKYPLEKVVLIILQSQREQLTSFT